MAEGNLTLSPHNEGDSGHDELNISQRIQRLRTRTEKGKSEHLRLLRNKTIGALSSLTKCKNKLESLMVENDNLHLVKSCFHSFTALCSSYETCNEIYSSALESEEARIAAVQHAETNMNGIEAVRANAERWIQNVERELFEQVLSQSRYDSAMDNKSQISNKSNASHASSSQSSRTKEKAKLAELLTERAMFQTQSKINELQLDIDIAKATARQKAFEDPKEQLIPEKEVNTPDHGENFRFVPRDVKHEDSFDNTAQSHVKFEHPLNPNATEYQSVSNDYQPGDTFIPCNASKGENLPNLHYPFSVANHQFLETQHQMANAMFLPQPEVPKFRGDPTEFAAFMMAFDSRIVPHTDNDADRLYYLDQQLQGEPKDLISGCLYMNVASGYQSARSLLIQEYGDPNKVSTAYLNRILSWPVLKNDDFVGLKQFSFYLRKCYYVMQSMSSLLVLNHSPHLQCIVLKLPQHLQSKWRDRVTAFTLNGQGFIGFKDLVDFIDFAAKSANEPTYGKQALTYCQNNQQPRGNSFSRGKQFATKSQSTSFVTQVGNNDSKGKSNTSSCFYCKQPHDLDECKSFKQKSLFEKRDFLKSCNRCFACYQLGHSSKGCLRKRTCKICSKRHPTAMHDSNFSSTRRSIDNVNDTGKVGFQSKVGNDSTCCNASKSNCVQTVFQPILPVKVKLNDGSKSLTTYAMLDNGSTGCFISEDLVSQLDATSTPVTLKLQTMNGTDFVNTSVVTGLVVTDLDEANHVSLPRTFSRDVMPVDHTHIPKPELLKQLPHLRKVADRLPVYMPNLDIGILIGSNCPNALQPLEVVSSNGSGPFAVLYKHGWTINGPVQVKQNLVDNTIVCNRIILHEIEKSKECITPEAVLKMFELDFSESDIGSTPGERGLSVEDRRFLERTEKGIQFVDGHFQIPLPFRNDMLMPCNRDQAVKRVLWQKKKMLKDETYHRDYVKFMDSVISKGYACEVPENQLSAKDGRVWYLPHHGVYHPKKPNKIRVVFDCSAKREGYSLNDVLLQGPDLANSLIGVLTRFRSETVAFMGDVEAMFHQVKVPCEQQDFLRFLWWPNGDLQAELKEYRMTVHTFGAVSSPSIANYALKESAHKAKDRYDESVSQTIQRNFYVDDCLKSVKDNKTAVKLIGDLQSACAKGGFNLTKFTCNSKEVLSSIPPEHCSKDIQTIDLSYDDIPMERALGMQWHIMTDCFKFSVDLPQKPATRRGILSTMSSLYDPLGLVSPVLLPAKKILQDLCRDKSLGWDDGVDVGHEQAWNLWLAELEALKGLSVKRCLKPAGFGNVVSSQLHIFSDASVAGYGCSAYLRLCDDKENIHTSLLMGKSRLAPVKALTIPRLELTAAATGVKIGQFLLKEIDIDIDSVTYYSDSTTVLHYICNDRNRYPIFVTNRVKMIRDYSSPQQWKYIDSKSNPADIASRGSSCKQFLKSATWFDGPDFLRKNETEWPVFEWEESQGSVGMVKPEVVDVRENNAAERLINHYSSWYRLKKAVAIYHRFFLYLQIKYKSRQKVSSLKKPLTVHELDMAESSIVRFVQHISYKSEIAALTNSSCERGRVNVCLPKSSPLQKLSPILLDGMLCVGGRISRAEIVDDMKHPRLLPRKCHVSSLIIQDIHHRLSHAGRNHVLSVLRERYWITSGNSAVRCVLNKCVTCRRFKTPTSVQQMSELPANRVNPAPPFYYTGVDFFGPHVVKEGRKSVKRYGALFTCLVSRAVHLETANSLDTDSFINALRRFISRRGPVKQIVCDNGTNFTSGAKELKQALDDMDQSKLSSYLIQQQIEWKFNPPSASHMGGVWERMVRSVRSILNPMLYECGNRLDDEMYRTLLCEVEAILNSRPLTTVSADPDDFDPISPNHLLMMKSNVYISSPGDFVQDDLYARKRWKRIQHLANVFWSRWKKEYLVNLQQRQKWNRPKRNYQLDDIVLLKDDFLPRGGWSMGRITGTEPDRNGVVRSVTVKTKDSELRRPIHKLVLLLPSVEKAVLH